jgi:hypothetical protein
MNIAGTDPERPTVTPTRGVPAESVVGLLGIDREPPGDEECRRIIEECGGRDAESSTRDLMIRESALRVPNDRSRDIAGVSVRPETGTTDVLTV